MNTISSYLSSISWYSQMGSLSNRLGQQAACSQKQQSGDSVQISAPALAMNKFNQSSLLDKVTSILDNLVSDGTISEEQESAVLEAFQTAMTEAAGKETEEPNPASDPLAGLVADKTITSAQQEAIKSAFEAVMGPPPPPQMNAAPGQSVDPLDSLVNDKTITQAQQEAIKKAFESAIALRQNRSAAETVDPLDSLVKDGTITEEQKNAVKGALQSSRPAPPPPPVKDDEDEDLLDSLVANGTITADQETAIKKAFEEAIKSYSLAMNYNLI
ncbi:hypothetical protein [Syntrophomonas palmitatica]|uniref:hypothetical protein n=1 Tax=Syntrophomonas palmitatica TaxID=402877 RepID=UPI0006D2BF0E|nr:hypothetical protein [Syntrophomonas palmitatica]